MNVFFGRRRPLRSKDDPYECGLPSEIQRGFRFGISFYLIAMLFILFDIEVIFLYPIAVQLRAFGTFALSETIVFVALLMVAFGDGWRRGAPVDFRARQLRARDMLRGGLEGEALERFVKESVLTTTVEKAVSWSQ